MKKNNLKIIGYDPLIDSNLARKKGILTEVPNLKKFIFLLF